ncbi:hypothetical protein N0V90_001666 [Kalmusia sp. IMI 367209]|nr:hypothetical protein N0V90_001666 [Kalmusia sp. IMI 367209]
MPLLHPLPFPPIHPPQILLAGATTYIGGTVLSVLLHQPTYPLEHTTITCLVRSNDCANILLRAYGEGVNIVVRNSLDDTEIATEIASKHDIVINCAPSSHAPAAIALMEGLAKRRRKTGRDVWMLHTSGMENLADLPISRKWVHAGPVREFDDAKDDIYEFEVMREAQCSHPQRTTELQIINKGLELGVKTIVIMNAMIYGRGLGLFDRSGVPISAHAKVAMASGKNVVIGDGKGTWDHVHVQELGELYKIVVVEMMKDGGKKLPCGKKGIIFCGNGRHSWSEVAQEVAKICCEEGFVSQNKVKHVGLEEGVKLFSPYIPELVKEEDVIELQLCSNSKTVSNVARKLGWRPAWREDTWKDAIREDVRSVLQPVHNSQSDAIQESRNSAYIW